MEALSHAARTAPAEPPLPLRCRSCSPLCGGREPALSRSAQKENAAELRFQKSFCPEQRDRALGRRFLLVQ